MICSNCGIDYDDDFDFCPFCGEEISKETIKEYYKKAEELKNEGNYEESSTYYDKLIRIDPQNKVKYQKELKEIQIKQYQKTALKLKEQRKYKEASTYYNKLIRIDPKNKLNYKNQLREIEEKRDLRNNKKDSAPKKQ